MFLVDRKNANALHSIDITWVVMMFMHSGPLLVLSLLPLLAVQLMLQQALHNAYDERWPKVMGWPYLLTYGFWDRFRAALHSFGIASEPSNWGSQLEERYNRWDDAMDQWLRTPATKMIHYASSRLQSLQRRSYQPFVAQRLDEIPPPAIIVCQSCAWQTETWYHCSEDNHDICLECTEAVSRCLQSGHQLMKKRSGTQASHAATDENEEAPKATTHDAEEGSQPSSSRVLPLPKYQRRKTKRMLRNTSSFDSALELQPLRTWTTPASFEPGGNVQNSQSGRFMPGRGWDDSDKVGHSTTTWARLDTLQHMPATVLHAAWSGYDLATD
ncbi:hypothetical protein B0A48_13164 [Cryoendolithus antarcticus]|uniref:Uncharacterized protein n=1 Tax=Cryoendolithus antarcticus TaxID=1507870 RepID=A0A1V8SNN4_9PEZI|nr:hypothetical protein B0A48_13164 [Cryoendolithus antarcticus]